MAVNLQKGQKVNLTKGDGSALKHAMVGLGWDAAEQPKKGGFLSSILGGGSADIDCDASAIVCRGGHLANIEDVVYFGNLRHKSDAVRHMGDNLTGEGEGDDEQIFVDLGSLPSDCDKIIFVVNIYKAVERKQNFGMIKNAFIRIVDADNNSELCRYSLSENYDGMTAMVFGELYLRNGQWKFNAIGQGTKDPGLSELITRFK